jgi:predicted aspartyl protease
MIGDLRMSLALVAAMLGAAGTLHADSLAGPPVPVTPPTSPLAVDSTGSQYLIPTRRDRIGRITAPVTINGRGPFRFMVDTGSNHTVIAEATLQKLGIPVDSANFMSVTGISSTELAPTAHVQSLDAGDMHLNDQDLAVLSGPVFSDIDGILGMDAFEGMKVNADFRHGRISIVHSFNHAPLWGYVMDASFLSDRLLMVDVEVGHVRTKAIIDTGGERTLGNLALLRELTGNRRSHYKPVRTSVVGVTSVTSVGTIERSPAIQMGATEVSELYIVYGDFQIFRTWGLEDTPAILIGMDVLGTLSDLTLDYRRKEVNFLPGTDFLHPLGSSIPGAWFAATADY